MYDKRINPRDPSGAVTVITEVDQQLRRCIQSLLKTLPEEQRTPKYLIEEFEFVANRALKTVIDDYSRVIERQRKGDDPNQFSDPQEDSLFSGRRH